MTDCRVRISNSMLGEMKRLTLNEPDIMRFLKKYFNFGSLVDALITEPEKINTEKMVFDNTTRYGSEILPIKPEDLELAYRMQQALEQDEFGQYLTQYAKKLPFENDNFRVFSGDRVYSIDTSGELDLAAPAFKIAGDIKVTACRTQEEFVKKVIELNYPQQGSWYMDNKDIDQFVFCGLSKKSLNRKSKLPEVFHFIQDKTAPKTQGYNNYQIGVDSYSYWTEQYLNYHGIAHLYQTT